MKTVEELVAQSVYDGVCWLDEHGPQQWWNRVNLFALDLASEDGNGLLTQIFVDEDDPQREDYTHTLAMAGMSEHSAASFGMDNWLVAYNNELVEWSRSNGWQTPWTLLQEKWIRVVKIRRGEI